MARLSIMSPEGQQEAVLLPHNSLGRHPSNTIQLLDRVVSKEHCHIDLSGERYVLRDLNSLNGTFVNGERVTEWVLSEGDEITLGGTTITYHAETEVSKDAKSETATKPKESPSSAAEGLTPAGSERGSAPERSEPSRRYDAAPSKRGPSHNLTITSKGVESQIRTKLQTIQHLDFLPEGQVDEEHQIREDYEKLRASYEVIRAIGVELNVDKLLAKILDCAFHLLDADRGVVLLYDEKRALQPRCVRTKQGREQESILLSKTILNEVLKDKAAVISSDASIDSRFQGAHSVIMQGIRSTMAVPLLHSQEVFGVMMLDSFFTDTASTEKDLQLFQNVANQAAIAIQNSLYAKKLEKEAITRERFERLLSPAIAEQVVSGEVEVEKGGQQREATILFSDIRGFTAMSEVHSAQEIVDMLNEYFERMVEVVFTYEGTLDKFIGDEIMALFGAPVSHPDDAERAVRVALKMRQALEELNQIRAARGEVPIRAGIGINTGEVVAGYLGSSRALEYTVIGDTVNTCARLCSLAKAGEIIISEDTYRKVASKFKVEALPPTAVKGKSQPLSIFRVISEHRPSQTPPPPSARPPQL